MSERPTGQRLTLFVPGSWIDVRHAARLDARWSVEWIANDGHFAEAFEYALMMDEERARIGRCPGALLIETTVDLPAEAPAVVEVARVLTTGGALGIRVEQSKAAWPAARWVELLERSEWFPAFVVTRFDDGEVETCGMHVFTRPDGCVIADDRDEATSVVRSFCLYQLDEDPLLLSGQTFRPDADSPRRVLERWPDGRHPASHPCHNPFGIFRLGAFERTAPDKLALTPVPALVAVLLAAERQAGHPLTRGEVEAIRDGAACIAMEQAHARALERSRGYADLDPELVWEQWQIARAALTEA